jgi:hypothetical protein
MRYKTVWREKLYHVLNFVRICLVFECTRNYMLCVYGWLCCIWTSALYTVFFVVFSFLRLSSPLPSSYASCSCKKSGIALTHSTSTFRLRVKGLDACEFVIFYNILSYSYSKDKFFQNLSKSFKKILNEMLCM